MNLIVNILLVLFAIIFLLVIGMIVVSLYISFKVVDRTEKEKHNDNGTSDRE